MWAGRQGQAPQRSSRRLHREPLEVLLPCESVGIVQGKRKKKKKKRNSK